MRTFKYQEAQKFLTDYWWLNPQQIECFEQKYRELAISNPMLPSNPREEFRDDVDFFAFSSLFGEEFFTYCEATEYCSNEYFKLRNHVDLQRLLRALRKKEPRLPSNPACTYKEQWTTWSIFFKVDQLVVEPLFYTFSDLREKCIERLAAEAVKPLNLQKLYQSFKHSDVKIPKNPYLFYKKTGDWVSWNDLFGLETTILADYCTAKDFCIKRYLELRVKPTNLADFYLYIKELHREDISLPRHPDDYYAKTKEWQSYKSLFGLNGDRL